MYGLPENRDPHLGTVHQSERNSRAIFCKFSKDGLSDLLDSLRLAQDCKHHLNGDIPPEYHKQINSEMKLLRENPRTHRTEAFYKQIRKANHLRDVEKHLLVNAMLHGVIQDAGELLRASTRVSLHERAD